MIISTSFEEERTKLQCKYLERKIGDGRNGWYLHGNVWRQMSEHSRWREARSKDGAGNAAEDAKKNLVARSEHPQKKPGKSRGHTSFTRCNSFVR